MKFIPDSIKKLFSSSSRKDTAAPAAAAPDGSTTAIEAPEAQYTPPSRLDELAPFKQPEGYYLIDLDVAVMGNHNGAVMHMIRNDDTGFLLALFSPQYLSGCKTVATEAEDFMSRAFQLDAGQTYYKRRDANFFFDAYDQVLGLPPGNGFQLVFVPEGCEWKPDYVPPAQYAIPGTTTILQHPATLLPQFQPQVQYPIIFVNGYDVTQSQLPEIPGAAKPEEKKPEQQPAAEAVATPAAAPPPPAPGAPKP